MKALGRYSPRSAAPGVAEGDESWPYVIDGSALSQAQRQRFGITELAESEVEAGRLEALTVGTSHSRSLP